MIKKKTSSISLYFSYGEDSLSSRCAKILRDQLGREGFQIDVEMRMHTHQVYMDEVYGTILKTDVVCLLLDHSEGFPNWLTREIDISRGAQRATLPIFLKSSISNNEINNFLSHLGLDKAKYIIFNWDSPNIDEIAEKIVEIIPWRKKIIIDRAGSLPDYGMNERMNNRRDIINDIFESPKEGKQYRCDVFMVMPFGEPFWSIYNKHIKPAIEEYDLIIKHGGDFFSSHSIMTEVWSGIFSSYVVIAECTGKNVNVFYELGIAHTLNKPSILLTQNIEDIPFDIRHLRHIKYDNSPEGYVDLQFSLDIAIKRLLFGE